MSSEAAHFLVGAALALPTIRSRELTKVLPGWAIPISSGILATAPDLDLALKRLFGTIHSNFLEHRGVFHSPFFLVLASGVLAAIVARHRLQTAFAWLWLVWAGCMITHPLLDSLTTGGGGGVMLLVPFTTARFHLFWRPLQSAGGGETLIERAWMLRRSEIPFCVAAATFGIVGLLVQMRRVPQSPDTAH